MPSISHYTYIKSNKLVVCDLQGVERQDRYLLADPAINSNAAGQYGLTDLGVQGIQQFFRHHSCNYIYEQF